MVRITSRKRQVTSRAFIKLKITNLGADNCAENNEIQPINQVVGKQRGINPRFIALESEFLSDFDIGNYCRER